REGAELLVVAFTSAARDDAEVGAAMSGLLTRRHADYGSMVDLLATRGAEGARDLDEAGRRDLADALSFVMSPEGHQQLVGESGWTFERYSTWLLATVRLLVREAGAASRG
ncbi:hypothetical protein N136_01232, partial [Leifsonia aquatica ATCC 14665]